MCFEFQVSGIKTSRNRINSKNVNQIGKLEQQQISIFFKENNRFCGRNTNWNSQLEIPQFDFFTLLSTKRTRSENMSFSVWSSSCHIEFFTYSSCDQKTVLQQKMQSPPMKNVTFTTKNIIFSQSVTFVMVFLRELKLDYDSNWNIGRQFPFV